MTYGHKYQGSWNGQASFNTNSGGYGGGANQQQQAPSTGYTPVSFDGPSGYSGTTDQFYGSLIDPSNGRPSDVLCRLADALFFRIDRECDVVGFRGTQHIEPAKYAWFMRTLGLPADEVQTVEMSIGDLYTKAEVPHRIVNVNGKMLPILDRRGWLHLITFEARAAPGESHENWVKCLATLGLLDPATNTPFPTPLPRSAFPTIQDYDLAHAYMTWRIGAISTASRARTNALVTQYLGAAGLGAGGLGAGAYAAQAYGGGANPFTDMMMQSQAQSSAAVQQQLAAMSGAAGGGGSGPGYANAAASVFSTVMGGGGFTGFGM